MTNSNPGAIKKKKKINMHRVLFNCKNMGLWKILSSTFCLDRNRNLNRQIWQNHDQHNQALKPIILIRWS